MLREERLKVQNVTVAKEYLALAVLYVLLYIVRNCLGQAEILHVVRDVYSQFLAQCEKVVNCVAREEYNGSVVQNRYLLLTEFLCCHSLNLDE